MLALIRQAAIEFVNGEEGMESVEYAIIGAMITFAALAALIALGIWVLGVYRSVPIGGNAG